ncbi:DAK2 domain-containing protein [Promicromonospora iranensis]|uniref:Dihydroxyacetone kinase-like predicted kinase n=1 Tax=Promicromonospora iranensis TaxID=1105144 RepID=A0ABU2CSY5_9MICO|nr:DAK2 domain-containing protein [Promicromonospora iranensis]MDR7384456.1 dihydroxyacetone kinase-like predicted kinase [Promicromonospora iranensis]
MTDVDSGSRTADSGPEPFPAGVRLEDPGLVRAWTRGATAALRREREAIDRVNVFPVADADTGTNLYLTLREGDRAVVGAPADATGPQLLATLARAALLGAYGNSGVILSEWLRGLAVAARHGGGAADLLGRAATSARSAVAQPAEGTILTAADAAASAARAVESASVRDLGAGRPHDAGLLPVVTAAAAAARTAARASRDELDDLRTAGVLDAGALGLVLVLDALVVAAAGVSEADGSMESVNLDQLLDPASAPLVSAAAVSGVPGAGAPADEAGGVGPHGAGAGAGALELMFVLTRPVEAAFDTASDTVASGLRAALGKVGDSVVVVGGDAGTGTGVWQAHVHTDHLDQALAIAVDASAAGSLSQVHVRHLEAVTQHQWGVVAATSAPVLAAELAHAGAVVLLTGGLDSTVEELTADDVGRVVASTGARQVLLLGVPDGPADVQAHTDVGELVTVPTPTDVHAVVALAALGTLLPVGLLDEPGDAPGTDARAIVDEALAGLTVTTVRADAAVDALRGAAGPATTVVTALLDADVPDGLPDRLAATLAERTPEAELVVLATGRPGDGVCLGTEEEHA